MAYFNFLKSKARAGFTLIEIIVVTSIMVVLSTAIIIQVRNVSPTQELENGTDLLRSYLSQLRVKSMTGQSCCDGVIPQGYLVSIPLNTSGALMTQYAAVEYSDMAYTEGGDIITQSINLPSAIKLISCADATRTYTEGDCIVGVRSFAAVKDSQAGPTGNVNEATNINTADTGQDTSDGNVGFNEGNAQGNLVFTLQHAGSGATSTVSIHSMTLVVQ